MTMPMTKIVPRNITESLILANIVHPLEQAMRCYFKTESIPVNEKKQLKDISFKLFSKRYQQQTYSILQYIEEYTAELGIHYEILEDFEFEQQHGKLLKIWNEPNFEVTITISYLAKKNSNRMIGVKVKERC